MGNTSLETELAALRALQAGVVKVVSMAYAWPQHARGPTIGMAGSVAITNGAEHLWARCKTQESL